MFFTCILSQICHATHKQAHLIANKQITTSALARMLINTPGSIVCGHIQPRAAMCALAQSVIWKAHIYTHTHRSHFHTSMYSHFLCVASASFLPLHADCVSGIGVKVWSHTQAVRSAWLLHTLNGLYEWLGLND